MVNYRVEETQQKRKCGKTRLRLTKGTYKVGVSGKRRHGRWESRWTDNWEILVWVVVDRGWKVKTGKGYMRKRWLIAGIRDAGTE